MMRKSAVVALAVLVTLVLGGAPANAKALHRPWVPLPSAPFDLPAGAYCAFGVHGEPTVDEVRTKTIEEYPDGSPKRQLATGALIFALTNTATGTRTVADAGGSAVFEFHPDGSRTWHVIGPVLAAFRAGGSNIAQGVWTIDGRYDVDFSPANFKTVTVYRGHIHDLCADLAR